MSDNDTVLFRGEEYDKEEFMAAVEESCANGVFEADKVEGRLQFDPIAYLKDGIFYPYVNDFEETEYGVEVAHHNFSKQEIEALVEDDIAKLHQITSGGEAQTVVDVTFDR